MKVAIIGAGASGLVCSIYAKSDNNEVYLFEKNNYPGKKILLTGNGKCNYFNENLNTTYYHSTNEELLSNIINDNNKGEILKLFDNIGIVPKIVNGYYYPFSNQAITVKESLTKEAKRLNVKIITDYEVLDIKYNGKYIINNELEFDILVVATGGLSYPKTGSTGFGYDIAYQFNHSLIKPLPALVQLKSNNKYLKDWEGVRTDVIINSYENNKLVATSSGEIQLTNYGVSGICIYELSSNIVRGLDNKRNEYLTINFVPFIDIDIKEYLSIRNKKLNNRCISDLLDGMLNYKLVNLILKKNNINSNKKYSELTSNEIDNLCKDLVEYKLEITGYNDFNSAQVTSGGIPISEINTSTMESLKQNNLYLIGELLDIDGVCGGYNLANAFITGMLAGKDIRSKYD